MSHRTLFPARRQALYLAITRVHTMPLSSKTIARVAPQTAQPLTVTCFVRPIAAIVRLGGVGVNVC